MALTPEQQSIVAEYTRQQRATVGEFARLLNHMAALDAMYDGQVVAAWASLASGDVIADGSGPARGGVLSVVIRTVIGWVMVGFDGDSARFDHCCR